MQYRNLTDKEIEQLEHRFCSSDDWKNVFVADDFDVTTIYNSHFSGKVQIGSQKQKVRLCGGVECMSGIYNSTIHNCSIGNNCYIKNVQNYIANYNIGDNVVIDNVQLIVNEGRETFGNGIKISVLDESGGRAIMMYDSLSAQIAYIMTLYRYRPQLIRNIEKIIDEYSKKSTSERGFIGDCCRIVNSGSLMNMKIGSHTNIDGMSRMENGTVISNSSAPVFIGNNVVTRDTIILSGSKLDDGVMLCKCFIGQGCELGKSYSAENSVFFANCQGFHGEACSIFAGPYTVTHHKSTLLIAGMYSFLNAGSGSNQSNHKYKLGPIHQGIVERGSKTTSDSYLLWPAKIGSFTLVMGRHHNNSDTSDLPFSYLIENDDKSWISPGVNLRSIGSIRDAMKWPSRDRRPDPNKIDCVNCKLLTPYTIQKMERGIEVLEGLKNMSGATSHEYVYHNNSITQSSLVRGIELYNIGINKFLGETIIKKILSSKIESCNDLKNMLKPSSGQGFGDWLDIAGLIVPQNEVENLLQDIEKGTISDLSVIQQNFTKMYNKYDEYEWNWTCSLIERQLNKSISDISVNDVLLLINRWEKSSLKLNDMLCNDAKKEFHLNSMTGFGADGNSNSLISDFTAVRGTFETNSVINEIKTEFNNLLENGRKAIDIIEKIK